MGHDLHFFHRSGRPGWAPPDADEVRRWARTQDHMTVAATHVHYRNPETGTDFQIDFSAPDNDATRSSGVDTGIRFSLNYARPVFFGHEAIPLLAELAKSQSLLILDPQSQDPDEARERTVDELIESWLRGNTWATDALLQIEDRPRLAPEKAMVWWRYTRSRRAIERDVAGDAYISRMYLVMRKGSNEIMTTILWAPANATVFPPSDYIGMGTPAPGYVSAERVMQALAPYLEPLDGPVPLRVLRERHASNTAQIYESLAGERIPIAEFVMVQPGDHFVTPTS